ncbi:MAG: C40 family peptidase [Pyrinomonadaceae bacterium]
MSSQKMFPCMLIACVILGLSAAFASGQTAGSNLRQVSAVLDASATRALETGPVNIAAASIEERPTLILKSPSAGRLGRFEQLLFGAIEQRLGAHYSWGATGPNVFDCSGFVWSSFQSAGIKFDRASARSLWATFTPATKEEESKFGTLVFFSGLAHIGIVADKNGFYHASRHHGVVYSPFNDYWLSRIDGFRRVPLPAQLAE